MGFAPVPGINDENVKEILRIVLRAAVEELNQECSEGIIVLRKEGRVVKWQRESKILVV